MTRKTISRLHRHLGTPEFENQYAEQKQVHNEEQIGLLLTKDFPAQSPRLFKLLTSIPSKWHWLVDALIFFKVSGWRDDSHDVFGVTIFGIVIAKRVGDPARINLHL